MSTLAAATSRASTMCLFAGACTSASNRCCGCCRDARRMNVVEECANNRWHRRGCRREIRRSRSRFRRCCWRCGRRPVVVVVVVVGDRHSKLLSLRFFVNYHRMTLLLFVSVAILLLPFSSTIDVTILHTSTNAKPRCSNTGITNRANWQVPDSSCIGASVKPFNNGEESSYLTTVRASSYHFFLSFLFSWCLFF
jgi:hypothetical protein